MIYRTQGSIMIPSLCGSRNKRNCAPSKSF